MAKTKNNVDILSVGARLKELRFLLNKRQVDMAKILNISTSHYSKLEIGVGGISPGLLFAVSKKFGVSYDWLSQGTGPAPQSLEDLQLPNSLQTHAHSILKDESLIERIIVEASREELRKVAVQLSKTLNISFEHALATIVKESLFHSSQKSKDNAAEKSEEKNSESDC